jgi:hypothetical protein
LFMKFMWGNSIEMHCTLSAPSARWVSGFLMRLPGSGYKQDLNPETVHWGPVVLVLPLIPECLCIPNIVRTIGNEQSHAYMVALAVEGALVPALTYLILSSDFFSFYNDIMTNAGHDFGLCITLEIFPKCNVYMHPSCYMEELCF